MDWKTGKSCQWKANLTYSTVSKYVNLDVRHFMNTHLIAFIRHFATGSSHHILKIHFNIILSSEYMLCNSSDEWCCSWELGDEMCKTYQFVHSLSYTASIFILVVISTERYFAIIHPIKCKQILTSRRLVVSSRRYFEQCSRMLAKCCSTSVDASHVANQMAEVVAKPNSITVSIKARHRTRSKTISNPTHAPSPQFLYHTF
jgi:hypothetical protein